MKHRTERQKKRKVTLAIGESRHTAYGNFLLLRNPLKSAVIVSSKYSTGQLAAYQTEWEETARQGGVLVGAFSLSEPSLLSFCASLEIQYGETEKKKGARGKEKGGKGGKKAQKKGEKPLWLLPRTVAITYSPALAVPSA